MRSSFSAGGGAGCDAGVVVRSSFSAGGGAGRDAGIVAGVPRPVYVERAALAKPACEHVFLWRRLGLLCDCAGQQASILSNIASFTCATTDCNHALLRKVSMVSGSKILKVET